MQLFLDSAIIDEIKHAIEVWDVDGFTTNPRHVQASGKPLRRVLDEIANLVGGTDKPVSVEVNPRLTDSRQIVEEAVSLAAISANFVVKVGASESGFRAVRELAGRGVRTNLTLVFSATQAWHAARAGATYVSPFLGWKEQHGDECRTLVPEIRSMLRNHGYGTRVIAAALRSARQIGEAANAGAHCATASFSVILDSFRHPYTTMGEELFGAAWDATPREVPGKSS
jgi:transaldolase